MLDASRKSASQPAPAVQPGEGSWYTRRHGQILGPLSTAELTRRIERHALGPRDEIRIDGEEAWFPVAELASLLSSKPGTGDTSSAAAAALASANRMRLTSEGYVTPTIRSRGRRDSWFSQLLGALDGVAWVVVEGLRLLRFRSVQLALFLAAAGAVWWYIVLPRWPIDVNRVMADYKQTFERLEQARGKPADDDAWDDVASRVSSASGVLLDRVRNEASHLRPELQELALAGELLPAALLESQGSARERGPAAAKVAIHLSRAEKELQRLKEVGAGGRPRPNRAPVNWQPQPRPPGPTPPGYYWDGRAYRRIPNVTPQSFPMTPRPAPGGFSNPPVAPLPGTNNSGTADAEPKVPVGDDAGSIAPRPTPAQP